MFLSIQCRYPRECTHTGTFPKDVDSPNKKELWYYGTLIYNGKLWYYGKNYGTMDKTMVLY